MTQTSAKKYTPNLRNLHTVCEVNYARLMRLLPEVDVEDMSFRFGTEQMQYKIDLLECSRYTTILQIQQVGQSMPNYLKPIMQVRLYHDARMAEVVSAQHISSLKPSYGYPNKKMHQKNEKEMVNQFLAEWLGFCLQQKPLESAQA